jgi:hypothetical protein
LIVGGASRCGTRKLTRVAIRKSTLAFDSSRVDEA